MSTDSTFSLSASTSSISSVSSTHTFAKDDKTTATSVWAFNTKDKHATTAQLEHIHQVLEVMKASAAQGTKPLCDWIYDETAEWPLEHVFDAIFTFYPSPTDNKEEDWTQERSANFEHMVDEGTGKVTKYSKWYFTWAIQKWEEPMEIDMEWKKDVFRRSWHSNVWLDRRRGERGEEDVGPMGEKW